MTVDHLDWPTPGEPPMADPDRPTLRDQFAMAALAGLLAKGCPSNSAAVKAVEMADAMMEARK